jgi:uncharacterized protein (TIGR03086 family)
MTRVVRSAPDDAWDNPAPCEGWVARDVVRHVVEWMPEFLAAASSARIPEGPSVDDDPVGAWQTLDAGIQAVLDDQELAVSEFSHPVAGTHTLQDAISMFILGDVLIHTWDLARATGVDATLDATEVHLMLVHSEPYDEMLRTSGHYGPRVAVPDDADEQTRLIAFMGRRP